jgi:hypothetical protein
MAELKTKVTNASVSDFIAKIPDEDRRQDCLTVVDIMKRASKAEPRMWGPSIVGFGDYRYKYPNGREADWFPIGFSPRKDNLTLYLVGGVEPHAALLAKLGKHKTGKGCLYLKRLSDVDTTILRQVIEAALKQARKTSSS